jgi:uncharacterized protein (TIGR02145 family)
VCPTGWHVPSDGEWIMLANYLGGESVAGGKMKSSSLQYWLNPNAYATNESGFSGLPAGYRGFNGSYLNKGIDAFWWSFTENDIYSAWFRTLTYVNGIASRGSFTKQFGASVRCLRD